LPAAYGRLATLALIGNQGRTARSLCPGAAAGCRCKMPPPCLNNRITRLWWNATA